MKASKDLLKFGGFSFSRKDLESHLFENLSKRFLIFPMKREEVKSSIEVLKAMPKLWFNLLKDLPAILKNIYLNM